MPVRRPTASVGIAHGANPGSGDTAREWPGYDLCDGDEMQ